MFSLLGMVHRNYYFHYILSFFRFLRSNFTSKDIIFIVAINLFIIEAAHDLYYQKEHFIPVIIISIIHLGGILSLVWHFMLEFILFKVLRANSLKNII